MTSDPYCPDPAVVRSVEDETPGVVTFGLEFKDPARHRSFQHRPGQFNMVYLPGVGEVAISISSVPGDGPGLRHTIRFVGRVTDALQALRPGSVLGLRGPYGSAWPLDEARGRDVILAAGGLGLAPLRPAVKALLAERSRYGRLTLLYGARQPADLLYTREYEDWRRQGLELLVTVDRADAQWRGLVGVVPRLFSRLTIDPGRTMVLTCGPEIMMRVAVHEALDRGITAEDVFVSLERNMQCGVGLCGHCQFGPEFLCTNGPIFPYERIARFLGKEHF
ncbi:MAG: FAD/NAD(P)-binding protein [Isosphaeraceae bacterium]|nr:FAD/NAD(P)-binding protein [Isosphaeraceae bacterium]